MAIATTDTDLSTDSLVEAFPEFERDPRHYEVVGGERVETPRMGAYETTLASDLLCILGGFARDHALGRVMTEMLFLIDPAANLQRRPDLAFVSRERWPLDRKVPSTAAWDVVPDLAVEVVSPSNLAVEVIAKLRDYFRVGVRLVWIVYPTESLIHIWSSPEGARVLNRADVLEAPVLLPGFRLPLSEFFQED